MCGVWTCRSLGNTYTVIIAGFTGVKKFFRELLFLDGVYVEHERSTARFRRVKALTDNELTQLIHTIAHRHRQPVHLIHRNVSVYPYVVAKC